MHEADKNSPTETEHGPRPRWTRCCGPGLYTDTIETWEEYLEWLKTNFVGWTEEEYQSLIETAEKQIASMRNRQGKQV